MPKNGDKNATMALTCVIVFIACIFLGAVVYATTFRHGSSVHHRRHGSSLVADDDDDDSRSGFTTSPSRLLVPIGLCLDDEAADGAQPALSTCLQNVCLYVNGAVVRFVELVADNTTCHETEDLRCYSGVCQEPPAKK